MAEANTRAGSLALIDELMASLYPLCRSITGDGVRATLAALSEHAPIDTVEVPSGARVLDWTIPPEWNPRGATIVDPEGRAVVDFADHNLHLVGYSRPIRAQMSLDELVPHVHTRPDLPDVIPYRTSYWNETWGFCARAADVATWRPGTYEVHVDATLAPGSLTYGELVVPGRAGASEVLVSAHTCHPSLANDNVSGLVAAVLVAQAVASRPHRCTYRFLFAPGTIGAITWLATHGDVVGRISHGLVLTGLGDDGPLTYKRTRRGSTAVDHAGASVVAARGGTAIDYYPYGYDERQYCSLGYDLAVGRLSRRVHGTFPEYHTSADDLSFVDAARVLEAVDAILEILDTLEADGRPRNLLPHGEPQLGRRGLYRPIGGDVDQRSAEMAYLWILAYADGEQRLADIAERSGLALAAVTAACRRLEEAGLVTCDRDHVVAAAPQGHRP